MDVEGANQVLISYGIPGEIGDETCVFNSRLEIHQVPGKIPAPLVKVDMSIHHLVCRQLSWSQLLKGKDK